MRATQILSTLTLAATLSVSNLAGAQTAAQHRRAVAEQKASDHAHHTGAKVVLGSAAGGAVVGGLMGGGTGALIGGAVGAGGGAIANKVRVNHRVKQRERRMPQ